LNIEIRIITPDDAAAWLAQNTRNRPIKQSVVGRLSGAIQRGEWRLNGDPIRFNGDGSLLDGQHRLAAICDAGQTVESVVMWNVPQDAQDTMDIGVRRTVADMLALRGESYATLLAGAMRYQWRHESGLHRSSSSHPTPQQSFAVLENHPGLRLSLPTAHRVRPVPGFTPSLAVFLHYHFSSIDSADAEDFYDRVSSGANLHEDHPILRLRTLLSRDGSSNRSSTSVAMTWALVIKAWNAYRDGAHVKLLIWRVGGSKPESFPVAR